MKEITIKNPNTNTLNTFQLDDEDYDKYCSRKRWYITKRPWKNPAPTRQATVNGKRVRFYLSRVILGCPPPDKQVAFKDGNQLNLQKENLLLVPAPGKHNRVKHHVPYREANSHSTDIKQAA